MRMVLLKIELLGKWSVYGFNDLSNTIEQLTKILRFQLLLIMSRQRQQFDPVEAAQVLCDPLTDVSLVT